LYRKAANQDEMPTGCKATQPLQGLKWNVFMKKHEAHRINFSGEQPIGYGQCYTPSFFYCSKPQIEKLFPCCQTDGDQITSLYFS